MTQTLTTGPVAGHLRHQSMPMAMGLLAIFSFEAIDLLFISRLGLEALAAASFALPVIWLLSAIGIGFETGASSCVSRAVGRGDLRQARRLTTDSVLVGFFAASAICVLGLLTIRPLFTTLGATEEILPLIEEYMGIWYFVEPVATALWTCLASIRARGNTLLEGKVITAAALINALLDPILIFGWLGFPAMGIRGAAIASLIANLLMLAFTLVYLTRRLGVVGSLLAPLGERLDSARRILAIGVPAMITHSIAPISHAIAVAMAAAFGVSAVAGFGIAMRIEGIALIPFLALAAVSSPFFGQNFGAGLYDRLREARRVTLWFCLVLGLLLAIGLDLAVHPLASLFTDSAAVRQVVVAYIWIVSASYGAFGLAIVAIDSFNGLGAPVPATIMSILAILIFLPLAVLGREWFGLNGLFGAITIATAVTGCAAFYWLGQRLESLSERS
jgi:putative MATE family efflux protein